MNVGDAMGALVLSATVMLAVPLNDTPLIVLAVCKAVAVAALPVVDPDEPVVFWFRVATLAAATVPVVMLEPFSEVKEAPLPENVGAAILRVDVSAVVLKVRRRTPAVENPI